ncbi:MAG: DUF4142 domain-containing protein [Flavobacterium sp.]|nr:MAG: DUF4142 domain-containing protein [Flavobacterium sp.]
MKKLFIFLFTACTAISWAQDMSKKDAPEFIVEMADSRMATREAARIGSSLGTTKEMRDFASQLMNDEDSMLGKIKQLASSKGITLPNAISDKKAKVIKKLAKLTGKKFDKNFLKALIASHKRDIRWFKNAADYQDSATRDFAAANMSMLESHLARAKSLKKM